MDWAYALGKGMIQGLAEFLPVSSTAHLLLFDALAERFHWFAHDPSKRVEEFYDILLHAGTLIAVIAYFRRDLWTMARVAAGRGLPSGQLPEWDYPSLFKGLMTSFIVTCVLVLGVLKGSGFLMTLMGWATPTVGDLSELFLQEPGFVIFHLVVTGGLLWWAESRLQSARPSRKNYQARHIEAPQAIRVGVFQAGAAIFHGISRSGSTMTAGILNGWDRPTAARYSFLLSLPTFVAALGYESLKVIEHVDLATLPWAPMLVSTAVSALVGYLCIATFIPYLASHSLKGFSLYCWGVAVILTGIFLL